MPLKKRVFPLEGRGMPKLSLQATESTLHFGAAESLEQFGEGDE